MRARRLVAVASVAVGLVALSGCRTEPGVAAYIGDQRITEDAVTAVLDDARAKNPAPTAAPEGGQPPQQPTLPGRGQVVTTLVLTEVCERVSAEEGYQPQGQAAPEQVAQRFGLSPDTDYVQRLAALGTCLSGIPAGQPVEPTPQELADLVAAGKRASPELAAQPDEVVARQLDVPTLRNALGNRDSLAAVVERYDVTVNPRYRPLEYPLLNLTVDIPAVTVPLGEPASDTVTDVSTPDPLPAGVETGATDG